MRPSNFCLLISFGLLLYKIYTNTITQLSMVDMLLGFLIAGYALDIIETLISIIEKRKRKKDCVYVELPYEFGTWMKVLNKDKTIAYCGTVVAYTVTDDGWLVYVSGYKEAVTGEYLPDEVVQMTQREIDELIRRYE